MRKAIELKSQVVSEIVEKLEKSSSAIVVDYKGLTVEEVTELRKKMREAGVEYKVYKNTMLVRAFEGTDFAQLDKDLEGPTAVAFSAEDETAPARILNDFAKEAEALQFKSGVVAGTYYDEAGIKTLANIPSRDTLISKLLGSLQSPVTNMARVLNQIAEAKGNGEEPAAE